MADLDPRKEKPNFEVQPHRKGPETKGSWEHETRQPLTHACHITDKFYYINIVSDKFDVLSDIVDGISDTFIFDKSSEIDIEQLVGKLSLSDKGFYLLARVRNGFLTTYPKAFVRKPVSEIVRSSGSFLINVCRVLRNLSQISDQSQALGCG